MLNYQRVRLGMTCRRSAFLHYVGGQNPLDPLATLKWRLEKTNLENEPASRNSACLCQETKMQGENKITCTSSSVPRFLSPQKTKELFEDARVKVTVPTDLRLVQLAGADAITVLDLLRIVMGHLRQQALHKNGAWPVALANSGRTAMSHDETSSPFATTGAPEHHLSATQLPICWGSSNSRSLPQRCAPGDGISGSGGAPWARTLGVHPTWCSSSLRRTWGVASSMKQDMKIWKELEKYGKIWEVPNPPCYPLLSTAHHCSSLLITANLLQLRFRPLPFERQVEARSGNRSSPVLWELWEIMINDRRLKSLNWRCWTNAEALQLCHCNLQGLKIIYPSSFFSTQWCKGKPRLMNDEMLLMRCSSLRSTGWQHRRLNLCRDCLGNMFFLLSLLTFWLPKYMENMIWFVAYLPLWKIWKSMGRMTSHIWNGK